MFRSSPIWQHCSRRIRFNHVCMVQFVTRGQEVDLLIMGNKEKTHSGLKRKLPSNMNSLLLDGGFIRTIGDEESMSEVSESDSEDVQVLAKKERKADFAPNFQFVDNFQEYVKDKWEDVIKHARGKTTLSKSKKLVPSDQDKASASDKTIQEHDEETKSDSESEQESKDALREKPKKGNQKKKVQDKTSKEKNDDENEVNVDEAFWDKEAISFHQMNLSRPLQRAITAMNYAHPTPIQAAAIPVALMGRDICGCAATGTGKTSAYMLPVLERLLYRPKQEAVTRVLVLVPTRELAVQVFQVSRQLAQFTNIEIALSTGGLDLKAQETALRKCPDIVIATPGRLIDHLHNTPAFSLSNIEILILDEADRMLDEYFAEQMKEIVRLCSQQRQTMLFSATMTEQVKDLAAVSLKKPVKIFVNSNTAVAINLRQEFVRIRQNREGDREAVLAALLSRTFKTRVLVFIQTKVQLHRMCILLNLLGLPVGELHGNLNQAQRLEALRQFQAEETDILLTTDLAARGLDIPDVRTVINFTMPNSLQHYIHRVGRTARAGRSGRSVSLVGEKERKLLKDIVKNAQNPIKQRIIPPEIIAHYKEKLDALEDDVKQALQKEKEEKELSTSEKQIKKAENMIKDPKNTSHAQPRTWFQSEKDKRRQQAALRLNKLVTSKRKPAPKLESANDRIEFELQKVAQFQARAAKRSKKLKKICAIAEHSGPLRKGANGRKPKSKKSSFDSELLNTSRKAVKGFRYRPKEERSHKSTLKQKGKKPRKH